MLVEKIRSVGNIYHYLVPLYHHLPPDVLLGRIVPPRPGTGQGMRDLLHKIFIYQPLPLLRHADLQQTTDNTAIVYTMLYPDILLLVISAELE